MAKNKVEAAEAEQVSEQEVAENVETVEAEAPEAAEAEQVSEDAGGPVDGQIKVRVVKQVEGKKIGDEFYCFPQEYRLQIKHKSIEIIE
jgi:hypothetical protein